MLVSEFMTEDPAFVNTTATIGEALIALLDSHVRHLPVLDHGVVVGVLSDRDLRSGLPDIGKRLGDVPTLLNRLDEPVTELMSRNVISLTPDRDLQDAVDLLLEHRVGALPIVDPANNALVGILSYMDALRALREFAWG